MKNYLFLAFLFFSFSAFASVNDDVIISALKRGNAVELSKHFDNIIDLKLPEKEELKNISSDQAEVVLSEFFKGVKVKDFEQTSKREMSGTMYITGKLQTQYKNYNVTIMLRQKPDGLRIITMRIN